MLGNRRGTLFSKDGKKEKKGNYAGNDTVVVGGYRGSLNY
jgi:hypothetical protein